MCVVKPIRQSFDNGTFEGREIQKRELSENTDIVTP